jgi:pimeloyl-ACP methyl ester carboxylesterase
MRWHQAIQGCGTVEANGLRFAYFEWGRPSDPLVLLFHGFPDTAHTWDGLAPKIAAAGFRVAAPFLRGYAPSALPERDTDSRTLGEDVAAVIPALGAERARVVGHDWGAESVYAAVALAPERIERMVAIGIPHRASLTPTPRALWGARHFITLKLPGAEARFRERDLAGVEVLCRRWSPTWRFTPEDLEPVKNAFAAPGCLRAALGYYRALTLNTPDFMRAPITVPSLCVLGTADPNVSPKDGEKARTRFRGRYDVVGIPGGHFCHRESPRQLLDAVIPFLR